MTRTPLPFRRLLWAKAAYLIGFGLFLAAVSEFLLLPMMARARDADPDERQMLMLLSLLLLVAVLAVSFGGLVLTFKLARRER